MIEVTTNYGPNPAPPRYVYLGSQQPIEKPKAETPKAETAELPKPIKWSDFLLILMRTFMPFPNARAAVLPAIEAYEGASHEPSPGVASKHRSALGSAFRPKEVSGYHLVSVPTEFLPATRHL